jgi:hypothetical protein
MKCSFPAVVFLMSVLSQTAFSKAYLVYGEKPLFIFPDDYTEEFAKAAQVSEAAGDFFWKKSAQAKYYRIDNEDNDLQITVASKLDAAQKYRFLNSHLSETGWYFLSIDFSRFPECRQKFLFAANDIDFIVYNAGAVNELGSRAIENKNDPKFFLMKLRPQWKTLVSVESFCSSMR